MTKHIYKNGDIEFEYEVNDYGSDLDYESSLKLLHPNIKWCFIRIGSYQGDLISLGYDEEFNWYYKNNNYGSCSGCDWALSINNKEKAEEFIKNQEILDKLGKDKEYVKKYLFKELENVSDYKIEDYRKFEYFIDNLEVEKDG